MMFWKEMQKEGQSFYTKEAPPRRGKEPLVAGRSPRAFPPFTSGLANQHGALGVKLAA